MSYIEDFLEANMELPKDFIRNLKLIREIDEKVSSNIISYKISMFPSRITKESSN
jgi:hypothetical protein